jgi:hypothetical protein
MHLESRFVGDALISLGVLELAFSTLVSSILVDRFQALYILRLAPREGRVNDLYLLILS